MTTRIDKPTVKLVGVDGNAFAVMGAVSTALTRAGWTPEERKDVLDDMMSSDYDHLMQAVCKVCEVE